MTDPSVIKQNLRRDALQRRRSMSSAERNRWSQAVADRLLRHVADLNITSCASYLSLPEEVQTRFIHERLDASVNVFVPSWDAGSAMYRYAYFDARMPLTVGPYDVPQPRNPIYLEADRMPDLLLIPAVACDRSGHRLGYGSGAFDRLLDDCPARPRVALIFDCQWAPDIPAEPHDLPMDAVCTDTEWVSRSAHLFELNKHMKRQQPADPVGRRNV